MGTNWSSACSKALSRDNRDAALRTSTGISVTPPRNHRHLSRHTHPPDRVFRPLCPMERLRLPLLVEIEARHQAPSVVAARLVRDTTLPKDLQCIIVTFGQVLCAVVRLQRPRHRGLEFVFAKRLAIRSFRHSRLPIDQRRLLRNVFELSFRRCRSVYLVRYLLFRHREYVTI